MPSGAVIIAIPGVQRGSSSVIASSVAHAVLAIVELGMNEDVTKTEARQGTGPRQMVSVLFVSMTLAILAGAVLLWYFYFASPVAVR